MTAVKARWSSWRAEAPLAAPLLAALGAWLVIALTASANAWREREIALREVESSAHAATAMLRVQTANIFQAVDIALEETVKSLGRDPLPRHDEGFRNSLRARLPGLPVIRALFVVGPDGLIVHDTDYPQTPDVPLADRPWFRGHQASSATHAWVWPPVQRHPGGDWYVAVSRRIDIDGEFRGVAVAEIRLRYFSELYQQVGLGDGALILLFHRNSRLLAQFRAGFGEVGQSFADDPLFRDYLPAASSAVYRTDAGRLPYRRVIAYAAVPGQPLVVSVMHNIDIRLNAWRRGVVGAGIVLAILLAALLFGAIQHVRARRQRRLVRDRLNQAEKMQALGLLTGGIAHDFGNMLNIVGMNLPLLRKRCGDDPVAEAALSRVERALESGTDLIRRLMSFSRRRPIEVVDTDLNEAIRGCMPLLAQAAGARVEISFEPAPQLNTCRVDRAQFELALINLVVNARHAMLDGPGHVMLKTRNVAGEDEHLLHLRGPARFVCVTVADNGHGMSEAVRRRAMEPFFTTKGEQGTGLGLAQIYAHLHQIGGDVAIESELGKGTAVHLYFPVS